MNVVVVSNRVARPKDTGAINGGLAAALLPAVRDSGAIWVGASGKLVDDPRREALAEVETLGQGGLATVDLPSAHYKRFYEGYANSVLWPAFHSRPDLIRAAADEFASYREINAHMASAIMRFVHPTSVVWIHDYHFLLMAQELRRRGVQRPIGFFLHTPFPPRTIVAAIPNHRELITAMLAFDLLGFQTDADVANFRDYVERDLGLPVQGDQVRFRGKTARLKSFPIGIDAEAFAACATKAATRPEVSRLRASLQNAKLVIGVDRVDYSKGLPNRLRAIDRLFTQQPNLKRAVSVLQIAVPSREKIDTYRRLQSELTALVGEVNGRHGEVDWTPVRYLNRGLPQTTLAGLYRTAQVGLVTPLNDGMNLVAKEYIAAQNPLDPGVLVLSEFAGAARQLDSALLVNPNDVDAIAAAVSRALSMPIEERIERWNAQWTVLEEASLGDWFSGFLRELSDRPRLPRAAAPIGKAIERIDGPPIAVNSRIDVGAVRSH